MNPWLHTLRSLEPDYDDLLSILHNKMIEKVDIKTKRCVVQKENNLDKIIEIYRVIVATIYMPDNDDPQLYAADYIYKWENTEAGKFVMRNSISQPTFNTWMDVETIGYKIAISAELESKKLSEYILRFTK